MLNLQYLKQITDDNKELLETLIDQFIQTTKEDLFNLQEAVDKKDIYRIKAVAHRVKGAAVTVGATELEHLLVAIEKSNDDSMLFYQLHLKKVKQCFDTIYWE